MTTAPSPALPRASVERLLRPHSVAIVGASEKPGALGAVVLGNLVRHGFAGDIHLINPKRSEISGRPCLNSIDALPEGVDVAILAIPRPAVLETMEALAARKTGSAIIFSAGFAEGGDEGLAEQREIARIAREARMVVEGPNCLGLVNYVDRIPLTFIETHAPDPGARAGVGIVSQSGAMAAVLAVMLTSRDLEVSYSISTGNEAASGVEDYFDYLIEDDATRVIALIVEQFRSPKRFLAAMARARAAGKTVVLLHPGKSSAARESAATHTGAMAGDYPVMRAKVERAGVIIAETLEELGDISEIALRCAALPSGGTAVLGESGAFKALTLDLAEELGLPLPAMGDDDSPALREALPPFVGVSNPLDLTAQGLSDPDLYFRTLDALFNDPRCGTVFVGMIQTDEITCRIKVPPVIRAVRELKPDKPVIFAGLDEGSVIPPEFIAEMRGLGVPYFPTTERALRALTRISAYGARDFATSDAGPLPIDGLPVGGGVVPEYRAKQMLAPTGLPFPASRLATSADDAVAVAESIGYPVVLKAQAATLSHKSDAGGVILNLADADAVRAGFAKLYANVAAYDAAIALDGALVEKMGARGTEFIVGAKNDPDWGAVVLVGLGGVTAEMFHDVRLLTPDMPKARIIAELDRLACAPLLHGFRGSPELDIDAFADLIATVARVMDGNPRISEIDINPVIVHPRGQGVVALDALMLASPEA